ncbi:hypothetical protein [Planotetraspora sp. GP83]|uniref:hypothetical protein n=1 Tax=Planotetraspora sp. GP83 TaxID=3156264 RepID=UPI003513AEEA
MSHRRDEAALGSGNCRPTGWSSCSASAPGSPHGPAALIESHLADRAPAGQIDAVVGLGPAEPLDRLDVSFRAAFRAMEEKARRSGHVDDANAAARLREICLPLPEAQAALALMIVRQVLGIVGLTCPRMPNDSAVHTMTV